MLGRRPGSLGSTSFPRPVEAACVCVCGCASVCVFVFSCACVCVCACAWFTCFMQGYKHVSMWKPRSQLSHSSIVFSGCGSLHTKHIRSSPVYVCAWMLRVCGMRIGARTFSCLCTCLWLGGCVDTGMTPPEHRICANIWFAKPPGCHRTCNLDSRGSLRVHSGVARVS